MYLLLKKKKMLVRKFIFQIILVITFASKGQRERKEEKDQTLSFQILCWGAEGLK